MLRDINYLPYQGKRNKSDGLVLQTSRDVLRPSPQPSFFTSHVVMAVIQTGDSSSGGGKPGLPTAQSVRLLPMASVHEAGFNNWLCPLLQVSYVLLRCLFVRWTPLVAVSIAVQTARCSLRTERLCTVACQRGCADVSSVLFACREDF